MLVAAPKFLGAEFNIQANAGRIRAIDKLFRETKGYLSSFTELRGRCCKLLKTMKLVRSIQAGLRVLQVLFCIICLGCSAFQISQIWHGLLSFSAMNMALFSSLTGVIVSSLMLLGPIFNHTLARHLPGFIDIILSGLCCVFFLASGGSIGTYGGCAANADKLKALETMFGDFSSILSGPGSDYSSDGGSSWDQYIKDMESLGNRRMLAIDGAVRTFATFGGSGRSLLAMDLDAQLKMLCGTWDAVIAMAFLNFALYGASTVLAGLDLKAGRGLIKPIGYHPPSVNFPVASGAIKVKPRTTEEQYLSKDAAAPTPPDYTAATAAAATAGVEYEHPVMVEVGLGYAAPAKE